MGIMFEERNNQLMEEYESRFHEGYQKLKKASMKI
jgi:hypothetical protein